jgi:benzoylformate decarboxylase
MATVREKTFDILRSLGMTTIFGNPGSTEETFLKDFPVDFSYTLALQEASALAMADGFSQATHQAALVNLHTAPGTGNALGNLVTAFQNKTPLIVLSGQQTRKMLAIEPWLTNVSATEFPKPWVKWSYEPPRAQDVPGAVLRAYAMATQAPMGPVFLSVPLDDWEETYIENGALSSKPSASGMNAPVRNFSQRFEPLSSALENLAQRLTTSQNPILVFGAAMDRDPRGWAAATSLAEHLQVPVWGAPASERACFPETHALFQGYLPFAIAPLAEKLKGHDLVCVFGAPVFRYYPYVAGEYLPSGCELVQISDDANEISKAPVGDGILGDPVIACERLLQLRPERRKARAVTARALPEKAFSLASSPLSAAFVFQTLAELKSPETILVNESPSNLSLFRQHLRTTRPASYYSMASGGLGFGLPCAVGVALSEKKQNAKVARPVVAVIGDGSLQYSIQALWSAAQNRLDLVVLVMRNFQYGILKSFAQHEATPGVPGLDLPGLDIMALAQGYGCRAIKVENEEQLRRAFLHLKTPQDGPLVIEVVIDRAVPNLL